MELNRNVIEDMMFDHTAEEIATELKCSRRSLYRYLKTIDLVLPNKEEREKMKLVKYFTENDPRALPKSLQDLSALIGVSIRYLRQYVDSQKIDDLKRAEKVLSVIKAKPDYLWNDKISQFKTRNIKNLKLTHDRISREINLLIYLKNKDVVLRNYADISEFEKTFIK